MKAKEIRDLIDFISKSGLEEVNIETEEFKIKVKRNPEHAVGTYVPAPAPAPIAAPAPVAAPIAAQPAQAATDKPAEPAKKDDAKYVAIKSPMIGTFYRTPTPDSPAFVNVGDKITAGKPVCIIEAMKLFNEIESDISGTIVKVLVDNATPVEYDQPLFLVDPS